MNRLLIAGAAAIALIAGAVWWMTQSRVPEGDPTAQTEEAAWEDIDTSGIVEMTMGPEDAEVTVTEYASFTCPHCADFHETQFKKLKSEYIDEGKIRFVYRDVYFDQLGLWASMVARCGGEEKFFGIADMIYDQQRDWIGEGDPVQAGDALRKIGRAAGLDAETVNACLENEEQARTLVAWFRQHAEADDIDSTPTILINGEKYGNMSYSDLSRLIDEKLAE
ncbi:DsbA family protein [Roseovarius sp. SCSIO 43702]|uniref:DsbA family protein n=1 Tax=Roseovarius sp. SCSIO 43702 TaxID=2823043 RepID=UPI001C7386CC|nr:DsbA family protein [Roseovarius sp. SCSIO 43702]QYX56897.1 DsbA family protein [Roseovarius sp. SCSIO 43702]